MHPVFEAVMESAHGLSKLLSASPELVRVRVHRGELGSLPLHLAVQSAGASGTEGAIEEQLEIIRLLLEHGAKASAKDSRGRTVLDWTTNERIVHVLKAKPRRGSG